MNHREHWTDMGYKQGKQSVCEGRTNYTAMINKWNTDINRKKAGKRQRQEVERQNMTREYK